VAMASSIHAAHDFVELFYSAFVEQHPFGAGRGRRSQRNGGPWCLDYTVYGYPAATAISKNLM